MLKNITAYLFLFLLCSCTSAHKTTTNQAITKNDSTKNKQYTFEYITIKDSFTKENIVSFIKIDSSRNKRDTILFSTLSELDEKREVKDTFEYFTIIDSIRPSYILPTKFVKPKKWKKMEEARAMGDMFGDWYGNSYSDTFNLKLVLSIIDTEKDLYRLGSAKSWCIHNYQQAFEHLVVRLTDKRKVGLTGTADLIIDDRIETNDLKFYGHGGVIFEDIFTVAGRASWILNQLTGENFAEVHGNLTKKEAIKFQLLWVKYIKKLRKKS